MNDKLIFSDGKILYISLTSKVSIWLKILLVLLNVILYGVVVAMIYFTEKEDMKSIVFPVIGMSSMFFFFATRPMLWNVFGSERIIISKDHISFSRSYGLYKTQLVNVVLENGLFIQAEEEVSYYEGTHVLISFFEMIDQDKTRFILRTGIKTPFENFERIKILLDEVFEVPEIPFSMN